MEAEPLWLVGGTAAGPHLLPPRSDRGSLDLRGIPFESGLEIPSLFRENKC